MVALGGCPPTEWKGLAMNQRTLYTIVAVLVGIAALIFILRAL
ncbi:MAG TPA: hypothetical protein VK891_11760 [Euzebyales bacterium]|nr:hypothetical protein [Euzebyales bacterium]